MNCTLPHLVPLATRFRSLACSAALLTMAAVPARSDDLLRPGLGAGSSPLPQVILYQKDPATEKASRKPAKKGEIDFTELSLEELLQQEINPINVLGAHTHPAGQFMVGYRFMYMSMDDMLDGTREVNPQQILRRYITTPTSMQMEMHMLELMYAPSDDLTWMVMVPYKRMWMEKLSLLGPGGGHGGHSALGAGRASGPRPKHIGGGAGADGDVVSFEQSSAGFGDVTAMALYTLRPATGRNQERWLFNGGISFPSGSIRKTHDGRNRHEYMMQLGSGTVDLMPGITYLAETEQWAWGAQAVGTVRLGRNSVGYRQGHQFRLNAWTSYRLNDWVAPTVRLEGQLWGKIHGADPTLDPLIDPTNDPNLYNGRRVDLLLGVNLYAPKGRFKGQRVTLEGGVPVHQWLKGPQLETDWQITLAWSYTR